VDGLLEEAKAAFARLHDPTRPPGAGGDAYGPAFNLTFARLLSRAERSAGGGAAAAAAPPPPPAPLAPSTPAPKGEEGGGGAAGAEAAAAAAEEETPTGAAFDLSRVARRGDGRRPGGRGRGGGRGGGAGPPPGLAPPAPGLSGPSKKAGKGGRTKGGGKEAGEAVLDLSEPAPAAAAAAAGATPVAAGTAAPSVDLTLKSRVDEEEDVSSSDEEEEGPGAGGASSRPANGKGGAPAPQPPSGALGSFVRSLGLALAGSSSLTKADIAPALDGLKARLMTRNVSEPVAAQVCASVAASLEGTSLASFTGVKATVRAAVEAALTRILTPRRSIDILREVRAARAAGRPYTVVFVGVNGVGKSTSLAKVAYWLRSNGVSVLIAACDTFRAGAVEQLKTHAARLGVPLFERGYEKDPARVAADAVKAAAREGIDVVLVDTAGRMQDNDPLMRALAGLVSANDPDLVLFVGEALVGHDGVDQLTTFNSKLLELAPPRKGTGTGGGGGGGAPAAGDASSAPPLARAGRGCAVDGVLLTKFDTIDDQVGAAVSMVYASGAPVMFVGCGQGYVDLKRLSVRGVVRSLLRA